MNHPRVDPEFERLLPQPTDYEFEQLEASILAEGCRDALVVWRGIVADGHNRLRICREYGVEYRTRELTLETREEVLNWIDTNQLARRNLSPDQAALVRGRIYNRAKMTKAEAGAMASKGQSGDCLPRGCTAERIAPELGVSERTLERDGAFAAAVDKVAEVAPEIHRRVAAGTSPPRQAVIRAAKLVDEEPEAAAEIVTPKPHVSHNSGENEWYTPPEYIEAARCIMGGIDLDPASSKEANKVIGASQIFTLEDSGLDADWSGRVWLNPPYSQPQIGQFCARLISHIYAGKVTQAIALTNNATETAWGQLLLGVADAVCFLRGRVRFYRPGGKVGAPLQGQMLCYFGANTDDFRAAFKSMGVVVCIHGG